MIQPSTAVKLSSVVTAAIDKTILEQIEEERENLIIQSVKDYEQKLRARIGRIAINVTEWYSMQIDGNKITLQVLIDKHDSRL